MQSNRHRCQWCNNTYTSAGAYNNHIHKKHPDRLDRFAPVIPLPRRTQHASRDVGRSPEMNPSAPAYEIHFEDLPEDDVDPMEPRQNADSVPEEPQQNEPDEPEQDSDVEEFPNAIPSNQEHSQESNQFAYALVQQFPSAYEAGEPVRESPFSNKRSPHFNHLFPFLNARDFKLARFFTESKVSKTRINEFFRDEIIPTSKMDSPTSRISFRSGHTMERQIKTMIQDPSWESGYVEFALRPKSEFKYRSVIQCIEYLLKQRALVNYISWAPIKVFNSHNQRIYSEINTAEWWWEQQLTLPVGSTLIPILLESDQTHLTNFSGDKKLWPVYISLGNIHSEIRNKPSMNAWIPLALLPIPPKRLDKLHDYPLEEQELDALQVVHDIISLILSPLTDAQSVQGIEMQCCDEKIRKCVPKLVAWLADHIENCTIHGIAQNQCPMCSATVDEFGDLPDKPFPPRTHVTYAKHYKKGDSHTLRDLGVKNINNALWHVTSYQPQEVVKPDTLHTLYLGMLIHLMKWVMEFLTHVGRATVFDHLWSRLPPFPGFSPPNKAYRSITQWQGKEMRNLLRVILGVFTASISRTTDVAPLSPRNKALAQKAILCVRYLTDFMILAQYRVHTTASIQSLNDYLIDFHKHKDVFLRFRATKSIKSAVKEASRDLRSQQRLAASDGMTSSKRRKYNEDSKIESEQLIHDLLTENAHYNFPKMHLISHFPEQIPKYGSLPQFSSEICEASHKPLKEAYRRTNHKNVLPQIIDKYTATHTFAMREKNVEQWVRELDHIPEVIKGIVRPTQESIRVPLGSSSAPRLVTKLQGRINQKKIFNLQTLSTEYDLPDLKSLTTIYLSKNIDHHSSDPGADAAGLMDAPLEAFHTLQVPVQTFDNNGYILHRLRCTGPELFRQTNQRQDWVFVRRRPRSLSNTPGSLDGRVPARLNCLFKLRDPRTNGCYRLAHISLLKVVGSPTPGGPEGMNRVGCPMKNYVIRISDIEGMAHLIPVEPDRLYLVNNRIDKDTWNDIHDGN